VVSCLCTPVDSVGQLRGGGGGESVVTVLKQLCLFKLFTKHSMIITIMQGNK
jgi:hypothetical protein